MDTTQNPTYNITHKYLISYDDELDESDVTLVDSYDDDETENNKYLTMGDINKKFKFLRDTFDMGEIKKGDKVTLSYPYEGDPEMIEKVKASCGCTAEVKNDKVNKMITATYNSTNDNYGDGLTKSIIVHFRDNKELEIKNSLGVTIINPSKAKVALRITGRIAPKQ